MTTSNPRAPLQQPSPSRREISSCKRIIMHDFERLESWSIYPNATMMPSIRRKTAGRKVSFCLVPAASDGLLCHWVSCPLSRGSCRYLKRMSNSDAYLRRPSLRSMPETDNTHYVAEPKSVCLGRSDGRADTGVVIRSTVKAAVSSAPDRYGSSGTGAGSSGRYAYTANTLAHSKSGVLIDLSASAASSFSFVPLVLQCCCIAAVAAAARLDAGQPTFPVSVPVVWSSVSRVPSVLRQYFSSSAPATGRGRPMAHAPPAPARPVYLQRDAFLAPERPHDSNSQYGLSDVSCGVPDKGRKGESAPPPPVFPSDADNSSDTSGPVLFGAGLLLSVTGTLISALGDICIRYSFICHKASSAASGGTSTAEAVSSEEDPGVGSTGVGRPVFVEAGCKCGNSSENDCGSISSCQTSVEQLSPETPVATSNPVWPNGTGCTSTLQQPYFPRKTQHVVGQMPSLPAQRVHQRISSSAPSKVAIRIPALSQDRSTCSSAPSSSKIVVAEILPLDAADGKRKAAADTTGAALSPNTSLSLVSTRSSFLDCVSAADREASVNVGISDCGWSSAVAASGRDSGRGSETVVASNARTTPAKTCQEARRYQALNEQDITAASPPIISEAPAAEHGTTANCACAPMLPPAAAPGGVRNSPCGWCRWNGYWVLGISCTCIVSPVLSIISLSLLPANVTGFAALQIFFVVLLARYFLGEVVHRINLGGGVLVIAGLVTLTWSTESKPMMPDQADLYSQLISPSAVVFEVCCGFIVVSGLLLLFFTSYFEQQETKREDTTLEASSGAAVDEGVVLGTVPPSEKVKYAVLLPQQQSQQEQQHNVGSEGMGSGGMGPRDKLFVRDELYACLSSENRSPSKQLMTSGVKESGAPSRPTGEDRRCRMLKSPHVLVNEKDRGRMSLRIAATSGTARMAENNAIPSSQGNTVWVDNFRTPEEVSQRSSALVPPGGRWTSWYLYHIFQSRSILLPVAAGVSGSIASICLKLVQAFVVSFSAACHNAYNNHSHGASRPATAALPSTTSPLPVSLSESSFPALFTPLAAHLAAAGSWINFAEFPGLFHVASAPRIPSQSAASVRGTVAAIGAAQTAGLESTPGEAESATHLLLCLLNPMFLASHLQLPLLLVAAAAAALVELLFLSHTLKYEPASEGVPLMNAALTVSMGLGGLTLLGAAPRSALGWGVGLVLLVVGVGVLGFGGKTWLAIRRLAVRWFRIRARSVSSLERSAEFGRGASRTEERAGTDFTGNSSDDYRLHCRSDAEENAAAAVAAGSTGMTTLEEDAANMLRTPLHRAAAKAATRKGVTVAVEGPPVVAWPPKATCRSRNIDAVEETGGTTSGIAADSRSSGHCTTGQKGWESGPPGVPAPLCKVIGTADAESRSRRQLLKSPLLMYSEEELMRL